MILSFAIAYRHHERGKAVVDSEAGESEEASGRGLMFVDCGVAREPWHERFVLWVVEGQTCVVLTPDGEILRETLDSPPFRQVVHGTWAHNLPVPLGKKQGHPV